MSNNVCGPFWITLCFIATLRIGFCLWGFSTSVFSQTNWQGDYNQLFLIPHIDLSINISYISLSVAKYDQENVGPKYKRGRLYSTDDSIVDVKVPYEAAKMANTRLEYLSELDICREPQMLPCARNTNIVCTIGKYYFSALTTFCC